MAAGMQYRATALRKYYVAKMFKNSDPISPEV